MERNLKDKRSAENLSLSVLKVEQKILLKQKKNQRNNMTASTFSNILIIEKELYKMWNQNTMTESRKEEQSQSTGCQKG